MTPEERAANIIRRCWADYDKLIAAGEEGFHGLDKEIAGAIRQAETEAAEKALAEERAECEEISTEFDKDYLRPMCEAIARRIRARGKT